MPNQSVRSGSPAIELFGEDDDDDDDDELGSMKITAQYSNESFFELLIHHRVTKRIQWTVHSRPGAPSCRTGNRK